MDLFSPEWDSCEGSLTNTWPSQTKTLNENYIAGGNLLEKYENFYRSSRNGCARENLPRWVFRRYSTGSVREHPDDPAVRHASMIIQDWGFEELLNTSIFKIHNQVVNFSEE